MSTKTTFKRIALGTVAAMGFGLLSVAPANAAIATLATGTVTQTNSVVRTSTSDVTTVNFTLTGATIGDQISLLATAVPAGATGNTIEVGDVFAGTASSATAGSVVIGANKTATTPATCTPATSGAAAAFASRSALGVVTIDTAAAHGFTAGQIITTSATLVYDLDNSSGDIENLLGAGAQITILNVISSTSFTYLSGNTNALGSEETTATADLLLAVNVTYTAAGGGVIQAPQVVNAGDTAVDTGQLVCAGITRPLNKSVTNDWMNVAGVYTFIAWYDANNDGVKDTFENVSSAVSITVGGTPVAATVTPQTLIGSDDTTYQTWIYVRDVLGNPTKLIASEQLSVRIDNNPGAAALDLYLNEGTSAFGGVGGATNLELLPTLVGTTTYYRYSFEAQSAVAFNNGSVKISANFGGTLAPMAAAATASVAIIDTAGALGIAIKPGQKGVNGNPDARWVFPSNLEGGSSATIAANPLQALVIDYIISGTPNTYVDVTVDNNGGTSPTGVLPAGLTTRTTAVLIGANGTAPFPVTATSAAVGNTYRISANGNEYEVFYNAPLVNTDTNYVAELPTGVTKLLTPVAGTSTFTVTVADDYDNKFAGYLVRLTTTSLSRNVSRVVSTTSDINGVATVALTDAGTIGTDSATISIFAPNDTVTAVDTFAVAITYAANVSGSLSVGGGTNAVSTFFAPVAAYVDSSGSNDLDTSSGSATTSTDNACVPITHVLRDAALAPITGYAAKFTSTTGARFLTSIDNNDCSTGNDSWDDASGTVFAHANNQTVIYALASKTGVNVIQVEAGGYTQTINFTAFTSTTFARTISMTSPTAPVAQTVPLVFTATVTDGFGNVIPNASVNFQVTSGRSLTGASAVVVPTDAMGRAILYTSSDIDGVVGITAGFTGGQSAVGAGSPVATWTAPVASATGSGTVSGISPIEAAIQAAADAAAEAIDAGNNANESAVAAAEAAEAATAAAEEAGERAVEAANAATAAAEAATDAANEALDAANAATDAANASAEAADAATAAAQDAADAVAALSVQVSEMINALKKQITSLTNLVIKIQKKVKA